MIALCPLQRCTQQSARRSPKYPYRSSSINTRIHPAVQRLLHRTKQPQIRHREGQKRAGHTHVACWGGEGLGRSLEDEDERAGRCSQPRRLLAPAFAERGDPKTLPVLAWRVPRVLLYAPSAVSSLRLRGRSCIVISHSIKLPFSTEYVEAVRVIHPRKETGIFRF